MNSGTLFSIDVDAHLQKAASHTFGSPSHFPVELVRAALKRGADVVSVEIGRNRIRVVDNGNGFGEADIETLNCILDPARSTAHKEAAIEALQNRSNYGLLAIFAPSPLRIHIENALLGSSGTTIVTHGGHLEVLPHSSHGPGTSITLTTGGGRDMAREKHILEVYCFAVSKEVCLNGKRLGGSKPLPHQLVTVPVKEYPGCAGGIIGVPVSGDICRIRFMDTGIPYRYVTLPAHKGFLFDTALEYGGEVGPDFLDHLADCSLRLYRWLCGRHGVAGEATQNRIEELMFAHYRATGDVSLFREFSPFKLYRSDASLSFPQLARESRTIFAVPGHKERLKYSIGSRLVLSLTREQADFLVNGMEIPITFLAPGRRKKKILPRVARFIKRFFTRFCRSLLFKVLPGPGPVVPLHLLLSGEQDMVNALNRYLAKVQGKPGRPAFRQAVMVDKWSLFPTFMHPKTKILYINRRHTLVQTAMEKVRENRNNIELFIPLL